MRAFRFSRLAVMPWLSCLALLGWVVPVGAQNSGPLVGWVLDETGAPLPGVSLTITADDGVSVHMVSDHQGRVRIPDLRVGHYQIRAELAGFRTVTGDVDLQLGRTARLAGGLVNVVLTIERSPKPKPPPQRPAPAPPAPPPVPPAQLPPSEQLQLPAFPWPPPTPSARFGLQRSLFGSTSSQFAVAEQLTSALDRSGYSEYCFYWAPGGFALVARLERMREDGTAAPEALRFLSPGSTEPFSLDAYIRRLFFAPAGLYRQIIFVATDQPFTTDTGATLTAEEAAKLLRSGANRLPDAYRAFPFGPSHTVTSLIYEFRKGPNDRDVVTLDPGRFAGRTHLERTGILPALQRPGGR